MPSSLMLRVALVGCLLVRSSQPCLAQAEREPEKSSTLTFQIGTGTKVPDALLKSPDGKLTIEAKTFDKVQLIEAVGNKPLGKPFPHSPLSRMHNREQRWAFSPDGKLIAISLSGEIPTGGDSAAHIRVWDIATGKLMAEATPFRHNQLGYVRAMAFSDDSKKILIRCDSISGK